MDKLNVDSQTKPILKHRSISDILALGALPPRPPPLVSSPLYEEPAIEGRAEEPPEPPSPTEEHLETASIPPDEAVLHPPTRPPLWHTKSDSIVLRNRLSPSPEPANPSAQAPAQPLPPPQRKTPSLSPPGRFTSRKSVRSDSSSSVQHSDTGSYVSSTTHGGGRGRQNGGPRRHISFNSFVEQRIVIDPPTTLPTVHSRSLSDSGSDDDEQLEMRNLSSSGSLSSRRLSAASRSSSNATAHAADEPPKLSMITAPFPPALLKEAVDLPAPSPVVVFVPPSGVNQQALEYQLLRGASSGGSNGVRSPFGLQGARNASPISLNRSPELVGASQDEWGYQEKQLDYFSGTPVHASGRHHSRRTGPTEVDGGLLLDDDGIVREPVYTDEDADAITVRRRRSGGNLRRGRSGSGSSNISKGGSIATPPTTSSSSVGQWAPVGGGESSNSINLADSPPPDAGTQVHYSSSAPSERGTTSFAGISAPATRGRAGPLPRSNGFTSDDNGGTTSALGRSQSHGSGGRIGFGGIVRNASNKGVAGGSPSSGVSSSGEAPPFESRGRTMNGPSGSVGSGAAEEPPRRGRSLLRTNSSSSISERERSSTGGSSASPIGSLSPRPSAGIIGSGSVGIIGGRDSASLGIVNRGRGGSSLRYESGSWSRSRDASEEDGNEEDEDEEDEEEEEENRRVFVKRSGAAGSIRRNDSGPSLVRTSSSSQIVPRGGAGLVRSHSSAGRQDGLFGSNHVAAALPPPPTLSKPGVKFSTPPPSSTVRLPPPRPPTPGGKRGRAMHLDLNEVDEKESGDSATNSSSPWSASEFAIPWRERTSLELDSSVTPPSPNERREVQIASNTTSSGPAAGPLPPLKYPMPVLIRPKASGASLTSVVSAESNGSASSAATAVPIPSRINELRSPLHVTHPHAQQQTDNTSPVISASSSMSSNTSAVLSSPPEQPHKQDSPVPVSSKAGTKPVPPKVIVAPTTKSLAPKAVTAAAVAVGAPSPSPSAMTVTRNAAKRHSRSLSGSSSKEARSGSISSNNDEPRSPQRTQTPPLASPNSPSVLAGVVGHAKNLFGAIWGGGSPD